MTRLSITLRNEKRKKIVQKYAKKREALIKIVKSQTASMEEKQQAVVALQKLPRDASKVRIRNRCAITGRPRGTYRKFGIARNKLRELAMRGEIPGLVKASW